MNEGVAAGGAAHRVRSDPKLAFVARAMWSQAKLRECLDVLSQSDIPVLLLKGPDLQARLYGTPAAYASSDADVLIPRARAREARETLEGQGWSFEPSNGVL